MNDYSEQMEEAEKAYREMLDHFMQEIKRIGEKTPWIGGEKEPRWLEDMGRIQWLLDITISCDPPVD